MKKSTSIFYILTGIFIFTILNVHSQKTPAGTLNSFSEGDAETLSELFHDRLQINIAGKDLMCSKSQGKEIMRDFFSKNKPSSFEIIFEGGKTDSNFSIGALKTSTGNYRVNIFFKKTENNNLIHLLRIEKDDGSAF